MVILGIDEVGRGSLAGPVTAGAVIMYRPIPGIKDSKLLSKKLRHELAAEIQIKAVAIGLGWAESTEVDLLGLTAAIRLAMQRALAQITQAYDEIVIDGNLNFLKNNPKARAIIKADQTVAAVSAASIIAKVARDNHMTEMAKKYPVYGFDRHVGYGTTRHLAMLKQHGACELHRRSFKPLKATVL